MWTEGSASHIALTLFDLKTISPKLDKLVKQLGPSAGRTSLLIGLTELPGLKSVCWNLSCEFGVACKEPKGIL
uniref:Disease resistance protein n=1 Tax=Steinernema glaseri TaxID=37863 RepID=A0A1I8A782_9BILA